MDRDWRNEKFLGRSNSTGLFGSRFDDNAREREMREVFLETEVSFCAEEKWEQQHFLFVETAIYSSSQSGVGVPPQLCTRGRPRTVSGRRLSVAEDLDPTRVGPVHYPGAV